jgi:hypothetical protein
MQSTFHTYLSVSAAAYTNPERKNEFFRREGTIKRGVEERKNC